MLFSTAATSLFQLSYLFQTLTQLLNYVCVDKKCNNVGLLCSICKQDHDIHIVYPLKTFLSKLSKKAEKPLDNSNIFQTPLEELDTQYKKAMLDIRKCVQNLAEKFKHLEEHINKEYSRAKVQLLEEVQLNMKLKSFLKNALNSKFDSKEEFIKDLNKICSMVQVNPQTKDPIYEMDLHKVSKGFSYFRGNITDKLEKLTQFVSKQNYNTIYKRYFKNLEKEEDIIKYTFSEALKAHKIEVGKNGKYARQKLTGGQRFVLVNEGIGNETQKITFKVTELKNWIGVGVALKQKIKSLDFKFQFNNIGHGSYLVSSNGYTWSHSVKQKNVSMCDFKMIEGDLVEVKLESGIVNFFNITKKLKESLQLSDNKSEMDQICFCANLCSEGDSIEIID